MSHSTVSSIGVTYTGITVPWTSYSDGSGPVSSAFTYDDGAGGSGSGRIDFFYLDRATYRSQVVAGKLTVTLFAGATGSVSTTLPALMLGGVTQMAFHVDAFQNFSPLYESQPAGDLNIKMFTTLPTIATRFCNCLVNRTDGKVYIALEAGAALVVDTQFTADFCYVTDAVVI